MSPKTATLSLKTQCRRNRQHCVFGDNVATFGDNVAVFGDIVAGVDGALNCK